MQIRAHKPVRFRLGVFEVESAQFPLEVSTTATFTDATDGPETKRTPAAWFFLPGDDTAHGHEYLGPAKPYCCTPKKLSIPTRSTSLLCFVHTFITLREANHQTSAAKTYCVAIDHKTPRLHLLGAWTGQKNFSTFSKFFVHFSVCMAFSCCASSLDTLVAIVNKLIVRFFTTIRVLAKYRSA